MQKILHKENDFILRFEKGEDVIESLRYFCDQVGIKSGVINAIGAVSELVLGFYDLENKKYIDTELKKNFEIASFSGNISLFENQTVIHAHGVFSDESGACTGGHIKKMIVAATCETFIQKFEGEILREPDENIGLNLMK